MVRTVPAKTCHISAEENLCAYYNALYAQHGATPAGIGWSAEGQGIRFAEALRCLPPDITTLLDVGCGLGHFEPFLRVSMADIHYTGWDINENLLSHCVPGERAAFARRNILDAPPPADSFEAAICIGALNTNFGENERIMRAMITAMYAACSRICIMSATSIHADPEYKTDTTYFYDPIELFSFARTLTRYVDLRHGYLPHDLLLVLYKCCP